MAVLQTNRNCWTLTSTNVSNLDINYSNAESGSGSSVPRSLVTNVVRDYNAILHHSYSWGTTDTLYNEDSTKLSLKYTPRFWSQSPVQTQQSAIHL